MIEKDGGCWWVSCDCCSDSHDLGNARDFREAVDEVKEAGWNMVQNEDGWQHVCPSCMEDIEI